MISFTVKPIPIYDDNYVWLILCGAQTWVVDPGDHTPVLAVLEHLGRRLDGILITHRHWDHITGIVPLLSSLHPPCSIPVLGPSMDIPGVNQIAREGDRINIGDTQAEVWETPGHTRDHLSYYVPEAHALFCGDTMFAAGCGRIFDGTLEQLYQSLQRIAALPAQTRIYCTHEYTLANLQFALTVEADSELLRKRAAECQALRQQGLPTLPSTLDLELATNPFLRTEVAQVRSAVIKASGISSDDDFLIFSRLRMWKNRY